MPLSLVDALGAATALLAIPAAALGFGDWAGSRTESDVPVAATVEIAKGSFEYPLPGESLVAGRAVAPVTARIEFDRSIRMMKYQVSYGDYRRCVDAGACKPADAAPAPDGTEVPVTGVNYLDATAYAAWYSKATGRSWRLPTAAEWAFAAGERFAVDDEAPSGDPDNPAVAWIERYRQSAAAGRRPDEQPRPQGSFGENRHGMADMAGNVFEWTSTCLAGPGEAGRGAERADCGARILEGRHRTYMASFIRDGRSGGCATGAAPENLGFRLVRDEGLAARLLDLGRMAGMVPG
jgi:formylglycine-generating enzyme required for sulfatase activity